MCFCYNVDIEKRAANNNTDVCLTIMIGILMLQNSLEDIIISTDKDFKNIYISPTGGILSVCNRNKTIKTTIIK